MITTLTDLFTQGAFFMYPIAVIGGLGLMLGFERIITLSRADINTRRFLVDVKSALQDGGVTAAEEVCANTRGPVASIFLAGLLRYDEGVDSVERAAYLFGKIEVSFMERGTPFLSYCIAAAPILGFIGTVWGLLVTFNDISAAGNVEPATLSAGVSIALITTLFGLVISVILQAFVVYVDSKVKRITVEMEEATIELVDSLILMQAGRPVSKQSFNP